MARRSKHRRRHGARENPSTKMIVYGVLGLAAVGGAAYLISTKIAASQSPSATGQLTQGTGAGASVIWTPGNGQSAAQTIASGNTLTVNAPTGSANVLINWGSNVFTGSPATTTTAGAAGAVGSVSGKSGTQTTVSVSWFDGNATQNATMVVTVA